MWSISLRLNNWVEMIMKILSHEALLLALTVDFWSSIAVLVLFLRSLCLLFKLKILFVCVYGLCFRYQTGKDTEKTLCRPSCRLTRVLNERRRVICLRKCWNDVWEILRSGQIGWKRKETWESLLKSFLHTENQEEKRKLFRHKLQRSF